MKTTGTVADLDFAEGSAGSWTTDNAIPGGYTANGGLQITGKLSVSAAAVTGPWTDVSPAPTSPYVLQAADLGTQRFFRTRSP